MNKATSFVILRWICAALVHEISNKNTLFLHWMFDALVHEIYT